MRKPGGGIQCKMARMRRGDQGQKQGKRQKGGFHGATGRSHRLRKQGVGLHALFLTSKGLPVAPADKMEVGQRFFHP